MTERTTARGEAFGRYTLVRRLGHGGMGELFLARSEGAGGWSKSLVIKRILPHLVERSDLRKRFLDEGRIAATLSHANIVSVFDVGEVDGTLFLAMELVDGPDLRTVLQTLQAEPTEPALPDNLALFIGLAIASALAHAHERADESGQPMAIVHRDVSPANILLSREGEVKLTDFGIAAANDRIEETLTGELKGKVAYMSPEQARGAPIDARSDLYSLGLVLFELLTGRRAFGRGTDLELLDRVRAGKRPALDDLRPDLPEDVVRTVEQALATDPSERFPNAEALALALSDAMNALGKTPTALDLKGWLRERIPAIERHHRQVTPGSSPGFDTLLRQGVASEESGAGPAPPARDGSGTVTIPPQAGGPFAAPGKAEAHGGATSRSAGAKWKGAEVGTVPPERVPRRERILPAVLLLLVTAVALWVAFLPERAVELHVRSVPSGAEATLDGTPWGRTPVTIPTPPGTYVLRLELSDHVPLERPVTVHPREGAEFTLTLSPEETPAPEVAPAMVRVVFQSLPPGARVTIDDGESFLAGNATEVPLDRDVHLRLEMDGFVAHEEVLQLQPGDVIVTRELETVEPAEEPDPPPAVAGRPRPPTTAEATRPRPPRTATGSTGRNAPADAAGEDEADEPPAGPPGTIALRFAREPMLGSIHVNGRLLRESRSLVEELELPAGTHEIEVVNERFDVRQRMQVVVQAGERRTMTVDWQ